MATTAAAATRRGNRCRRRQQQRQQRRRQPCRCTSQRCWATSAHPNHVPKWLTVLTRVVFFYIYIHMYTYIYTYICIHMFICTSPGHVVVLISQGFSDCLFIYFVFQLQLPGPGHVGEVVVLDVVAKVVQQGVEEGVVAGVGLLAVALDLAVLRNDVACRGGARGGGGGVKAAEWMRGWDGSRVGRGRKVSQRAGERRQRDGQPVAVERALMTYRLRRSPRPPPPLLTPPIRPPPAPPPNGVQHPPTHHLHPPPPLEPRHPPAMGCSPTPRYMPSRM